MPRIAIRHTLLKKCYNNTKEPIMKLPRCQRGERTRVSSTTSNVTMEAIISLCKRRGFIYQGSDVYGGLSGTWDYGPLGVQLKRNIMNLWWRRFVDERDDMYGVDAAILMNQKVWKASGHVDTFSDPLIECSHCRMRFRFDKLIDTEHYAQAINYCDEIVKADDEQNMEKIDELKSAFTDYYRNSSYNFEYIKDIFYGLVNEVKTDITINDRLRALLKEARKYTGNFAQFYVNDLTELKCPNCGSEKKWGNPFQFNMMFSTIVGAKWGMAETIDNGGYITAEFRSFDKNGEQTMQDTPLTKTDQINGLMYFDKGAKTYLRPETAQGIFTNFKNVVDSFYPNLPFGIAQQGKAFRNEIAPRDFVFRSREFEQMEIEYFVDPEHWQEAFDELLASTHAFLAELGLKPEHIHELDVPAEDRAHYSKKTIDIEYDYPIGREELMGIAYRTDFDLMNIQRVSGKSMEYTVKGTNTKFVPHVIEPSFGVERALMAVLASSYREDEQNGEKRVYLALPEHLAPVKFAVSPLLKNKPELVEKARDVYASLAKANPGRVMWDDNGNIGKRYRRQDEIGTPHCVVIDFQTLEDGTVTVRERDTTEQKRVNI